MIQHPTTPRRRDRRHRGSQHRGLAALASLAIALPVAGLLWAAHEAHAVVVDRVLAGETATARGVAVEVSHGLDDVLQSLPGAAARPNVVDGTPRGDAARVARSLDITMQQEPLAGMAVYGAGGRLLASAGAPVAASLAAQLGGVGRPAALRGRPGFAAAPGPHHRAGRAAGGHAGCGGGAGPGGARPGPAALRPLRGLHPG